MGMTFDPSTALESTFKVSVDKFYTKSLLAGSKSKSAPGYIGSVTEYSSYSKTNTNTSNKHISRYYGLVNEIMIGRSRIKALPKRKRMSN
jgi:hypothetical protein